MNEGSGPTHDDKQAPTVVNSISGPGADWVAPSGEPQRDTLIHWSNRAGELARAFLIKNPKLAFTAEVKGLDVVMTVSEHYMPGACQCTTCVGPPRQRADLKALLSCISPEGVARHGLDAEINDRWGSLAIAVLHLNPTLRQAGMAGLPQNPTAARCDAHEPHPPESRPRPANLDTARQAVVPGPFVGSHDDDDIIHQLVSDAMLTGTGWVRTKSDGTRERVTLQEVMAARRAVHIGDRESSERWLQQREGYMRMAREAKEKRDCEAWEIFNKSAPMPQSAVLQDLAGRISERVMALINSQPRSPTKEQIAEVVTATVGAMGAKA